MTDTTTEQLQLFKPRRSTNIDEDVVLLLLYLGDGARRLRKRIAFDLGWSERYLCDVAAASKGQVSRAPGVDGFGLTRSMSVEQWQDTYGKSLRSTLKSLARQYAAQMRVLYGNEKS